MIQLKNFKNKWSTIICYVFGHKQPILSLFEDEYSIYDKICPRCKKPMGLGLVWKKCPPAPWNTVEEWNKFQDTYHETIRNEIRQKIEDEKCKM